MDKKTILKRVLTVTAAVLILVLLLGFFTQLVQP